MELIPAWLRFLESQGLIAERERADTLDNLRPLANDLLELWQGYSSDPALHARMERRLAGEAGK